MLFYWLSYAGHDVIPQRSSLNNGMIQSLSHFNEGEIFCAVKLANYSEYTFIFQFIDGVFTNM